MATTQPIRNLDDINKLKKYFLEKGETRNYVMVVLGLNTALRISDLLKLQWKDVYNFDTNTFRTHISVVEMKTKKNNIIALNSIVMEALFLLKKQNTEILPETYLIKSRCGENVPLSRTRAFVIIKQAATALDLGDTISCHSLRKTFGYQAWKKGVPPALLMAIYNHSSLEITKRYLCIEQDDKDDVFMKNIL